MERRIDITLPKQYIEIKPKQLKVIALLFISGISAVEFKLKAFLCFSGFKVLEQKPGTPENIQVFTGRKLKPFILDLLTITELSNKTQFLLDGIKELKPLPFIRYHQVCHYRLYNAKFRQYFTAENFFTAYTTTKERFFLQCLAASLYTLPWQKFNDRKIKKRARRFNKTPEHILYTVYLWFCGFHTYLNLQYPYLYSGGPSGSDDIDMKKFYDNVILSLSDGDITKEAAILDSPTHSALAKLNHNAMINEKMKKK